jgi:hypothetical protein
MVDLVLTADQIRSAPVPVREWVRNLLAAELDLPVRPIEPREDTARTLAECTVDEAARILEHIQSDYLACQVFFELGRDVGPGRAPSASVHRTSLEEIMHHVRLTDVQHLATCLDEISQAFRRVRNDDAVILFAFDQQGGCYVHEMTRRSIRALWQVLVTSRLGGSAPAVGPVMPAGPPLASEAVPDRAAAAPAA